MAKNGKNNRGFKVIKPKRFYKQPSRVQTEIREKSVEIWASSQDKPFTREVSVIDGATDIPVVIPCVFTNRGVSEEHTNFTIANIAG